MALSACQLENGTAVSILDIGHRIGDALVRSSTLYTEVKAAFDIYRRNGDATLIAKLAPTSIVLGAWDSRGEQAKLPRMVQSAIRAWDVELLRRSAQYEPPVDYSALEVFCENAASFMCRRSIRMAAEDSASGDNGPAPRRYILALALIAATEPEDGFLRQGCLLTPTPTLRRNGHWLNARGKERQ